MRTKNEIGDLEVSFNKMAEELNKHTTELITDNEKLQQEISERKLAEEKMKRAYQELKEKTEDLEKLHKVTIGRELEMIKLKKENNALQEELGRPRKYERSCGNSSTKGSG